MMKWSLTLIVLLSLLSFVPAKQDDVTRGIIPDYLKKRPIARKKIAPPRRENVRSRDPEPSTVSDDSNDAAMVGVTVWRVRPAAARDGAEAVRILRPRPRSSRLVQHVMERIDEGQPVPVGAALRLGIEVTKSGWLYIIDQEEYASGKTGRPVLIFPNIHSADNEVSAGRLIEVPTDPEVDFIVEVSPGQTGEMLTLMIAPEPLELKIGPDETTPLDEEKFAEWKTKWEVKTTRISTGNSFRRPYTKTEKIAATDRNNPLTREGPLPQSIYQVPARPGQPIMISLRLQYREK
jgi:hypothetical protein